MSDHYEGFLNKNSKPHGIGVLKHGTGGVYMGIFVNGKKCGTGMMKFSDGEEYVGEWEDDLMHGMGSSCTGFHFPKRTTKNSIHGSPHLLGILNK
jgi:hypothetical protein